MRATVIAIHGTFAHGTEWIAPDSQLCRRVQEHLPRHAIQWLPFRWSGNNSHSAREKAALALGRMLKELAATGSGDPIYLVGHSHGGNVALMALSNDAALQDAVAGVICLSTPFILAEANDFEALEKDISEDLTLTKVFMTTFVVFAVLDFLSNKWPGLVEIGIPIYFPVLLIAICTGLFARIRLKRMRQSDVLKPYRYDRLTCRILVLRTKYDEALGWIRTTSLVGESGTIIAWASAAIGLIAIGAFVLLTFLFVGGLLMLLLGALLGLDGSSGWADGPTNPVAYALVAFVMTSPEIAVIFILMFPLLSIGARGLRALARFGPWAWGEGATAGLLVNFSAAYTLRPSKTVSDREVAVSVEETHRKLKLRHSSLYRSPQTAEIIAAFIEPAPSLFSEAAAT